MLRLTERDLRVWADEQGISDLLFAELDYRLVKSLEAFYRDDFSEIRFCLFCLKRRVANAYSRLFS